MSRPFLTLLKSILELCARIKTKFVLLSWNTSGLRGFNPFEDHQLKQNDSTVIMDYKLTCFPCLRKKNNLNSITSSFTELDGHFEYVIDKYSIVKIPIQTSPALKESVFQNGGIDYLIKLNTHESAQLKGKKTSALGKSGISQPEQTFSPKAATVLPVSTHSSRSMKEKPRPTDILDSTSSISRRSIPKPNYVAIPSKASLHVKDIMITKREITNQYLNNFSSVFIDNLKDQVPKDPENLPRLGRPYTSALKNMSIGSSTSKSRKRGESYRNKVQKLVYSIPDGAGYETDEASNDTEDDYPVPVHSSEMKNEEIRNFQTPRMNSYSNKGMDEKRKVSTHHQTDGRKWITYDDIQALDVGYEFPNSEKYGVKPKMTKIRFSSVDSDRTRDSQHRTCHAFDSCRVKNTKSSARTLGVRSPEPYIFKSRTEKDSANDDRKRLKHKRTDSCYVTGNQTLKTTVDSYQLGKSIYNTRNGKNWDADCSKNKIESGQFSFTDLEKILLPRNSSSADLHDKFHNNFRVVKIQKPPLTERARPSSVSSERSTTNTGSSVQQKSFLYMTGGSGKDNPFCKSRSMESLDSLRRENELQMSHKTLPVCRLPEKRMEEAETEVSNSLHSRGSKTSFMTSMPESEVEAEKKATLRWKIIIKHRKNESKERGLTSKNNFPERGSR